MVRPEERLRIDMNCTHSDLFYESKITFFDLVTLTFLLGDIVEIHISTKFGVHMSNGSAMRTLTDRQTERRSDGAENVTSTADPGGNDA